MEGRLKVFSKPKFLSFEMNNLTMSNSYAKKLLDDPTKKTSKINKIIVRLHSFTPGKASQKDERNCFEKSNLKFIGF